MQNLTIYLLADGTTGTVRDFANAQNGQLPQLVRGIEAMFRFRLFIERNSTTPYPVAELQKVAAWQFAMDADYTEETAYKLEADNASITVSEVEENGYTYTEIAIPMPNTNTVELAEWMGTGKSKSGLIGELVGFDSDGKAIFILQVENWTVKNRITSAGSPTVIEPDYVTTGEVRGLIAGQVSEFMPQINSAGNWEVAQEDTGVSATGPVGPVGPHGAVGPAGPTGPQGTQGPEGPAGPQGVQGPVGPQGPIGPQGEQGERGPAFTFNATGLSTELSQYDSEDAGFAFLATDTGDIYIKNSAETGDWSDPVPFKGDKGDKGDRGAAGPQGPQGEQGIQGPVGPQGPTGAAGPQGIQGPQGIPGTLENLSIEVNSVTDGAIILDNPNAFPVAVYTSNGNCYPIEKESLTKTETGWRLLIAKYLAYDNTADFTGPWYVYCAGGVRGEDGWSFNPDARGLAAEKTNYDAEAKGFSFLAFDEGNMYFKLSRTAGDWTEAIPFRGERGEQGLPGSKGADGEDGADGAPGPMAEISISDNGTWVVNGTDTGESVRSRGANIIMSPTRPAAPYEGMIYIYDGENEAYFDLDKLPVVKGTTPPATAEEGTIFLVED